MNPAPISSPAAPAPPAELPVTSQLSTLRDWLDFAENLYARAGLALGQTATSAHDEALYLILRTLGLPLDSDARVLGARTTPAQRIALRAMLRRRVIERAPAAYITREAFLGARRYYVDERALIPRSYFLEIIPGGQLDRLLPGGAASAKNIRRVADVCTGSGCLAIELALHFRNAAVDAIDISPDALEVAKINIREHKLARRVTLRRSDVFDSVPAPKPREKYDIILSNPPYEPSRVCESLPVEFQKEPRLALDGGADGLDIIRKLLRQSRDRLAPGGIVLVEVGGLRRAMERAFGNLRPRWLHTADGTDCVCAVQPRAK
jgi:ribosomal protein L3 glutamine methyltransferase